MDDFPEFAKAAGLLLDQTTIRAGDAGQFLMIRQWLRDVEAMRLVCVPMSELGVPDLPDPQRLGERIQSIIDAKAS